MDKLHALYDSLMERGGSRRRRRTVPQVRGAREGPGVEAARQGSPEVAFRVAVKDGKVNFTVRGMKETKERGVMLNEPETGGAGGAPVPYRG